MAAIEPTREGGFHSTALVIWCVASLLPAALTSNPLYLLSALTAAWFLFAAVSQGSEEARAWGGFARFGAFFVLLTMAFNLFFGAGGETVLLDLPSFQPNEASPFQLGGALTLEGLVLAFSAAMALVAVILVLAGFNTMVDHYLLLRSLPAFLHQAATVVSIALSLLPQWVAAFKEIRQAQALRGHTTRRFKDFLPMIWVLLAEALEKAMTLAESMESRGFGLRSRSVRGSRWILMVGLSCLLGGWLWHDFVGSKAMSWALISSGLALSVFTLYRIGKSSPRTRYRRQPWQTKDRLLVLWSATSIVLFFYMARSSLLIYKALPRISVPDFSWWILPALSVILAPWCLTLGQERRGQRQGQAA